MKFKKKLSLTCLGLIISLIMITASAFAANPNDDNALKGVTSGKAFFDINLAQAKQVPLYLQVIGMTHKKLLTQGIKPDFVVGFRGPSVQFITDKPKYEEIAFKIKELKALGVKFEACSIATKLFDMDNSTVLPDIRVVGNTFISLIGYQAQGYGIIPIM